MSNIKEVKTRGATVVMVCSEDMKFDGNDVDYPVMLPLVRDLLMPLVAVVPLQLIAYYTAALKTLMLTIRETLQIGNGRIITEKECSNVRYNRRSFSVGSSG